MDEIVLNEENLSTKELLKYKRRQAYLEKKAQAKQQRLEEKKEKADLKKRLQKEKDQALLGLLSKGSDVVIED